MPKPIEVEVDVPPEFLADKAHCSHRKGVQLERYVSFGGVTNNAGPPVQGQESIKVDPIFRATQERRRITCFPCQHGHERGDR